MDFRRSERKFLLHHPNEKQRTSTPVKSLWPLTWMPAKMMCYSQGGTNSILGSAPGRTSSDHYSLSAPTFYKISQEEQEVTQADIQKEIELDNSFHEAPELFSELRVKPNFMEEAKYPVNMQIVEIVLETLNAIGIKDPEEFATSHHFYSIANFWEACQDTTRTTI